MKRGSHYGAQDVNRLYRAVQCHLDRPHRFACITDDPKGLATGIEARPLHTVSTANGDSRWTKLQVFTPQMQRDAEQVLFLDLDLIVTGPLDAFFELEGDFMAIKNRHLQSRPFMNLRRRLLKPRRFAYADTVGNTSCFRFRPSSCADVHEDYQRNRAKHLAEYPISQEYLGTFLGVRGRLRYWPSSWCVSCQKNCLPTPRNRRRDFAVPDTAHVVLFEGEPRPDAILRDNAAGSAPEARQWLEAHWSEEEHADAHP